EAVNDFGCKSVDTVSVIVLQLSAATLNVSACEGDSYNYNGVQIPAGDTQVFTLTNAVGCDSVVTVVVEALTSSASTLNVSACEGSSFNYNGTQIAAGETQVFTLTNAAGCDSVVTVVVEALPASASTLNVSACEGSSFNYNGTQILAGETQLFTLTNAVGCDSVVTVVVASNPLPVVELGPDSLICQGQTLTISAGNTGSQYNWSNGASTQSITVGTENVYEVTVTNGFGCTATDDILVEVEVCIGTKEAAWAADLKVFPNPSTGLVTLQLPLPNAMETRLEVFNALGQVVVTENLGMLSELSQVLDLQRLAQGTYFLRVAVGGEIATRRLSLQR
ncbi:MAG: T9SS type A sorting domain-containing protein, partial [Saprospiraceae bacterium]|nr:T9SS type A sorting domain-containing protein [Saprospiraceae bacterium]